jgi:hypothetical protein
MGLFDFFRRKPARPPGNGPDEADLAEPRCHHYMLAHVALRMAAFEHPLGVLGILGSPDGRRFLADVLKSVSEHCKGRGPGPDFGADDLKICQGRVRRYPCAVVEMPRPRATTEAFFVALVLLADPDERMPPADIKLRYFTLEKGFVLGGPPRTVLCEWTSEGSHANYGDGPPPRLDAFIRAVEDKVSATPQ